MKLPGDLKNQLLLGTYARDTSTQDAVEVDEQLFDEFPIGGEGPPRNIYWQKVPAFGYRIVVQVHGHLWRDDVYSLFALDEKTQADEFLSAIRVTQRRQNDRKLTEFTALIEQRERTPLIFREVKSKRIWIADLGDASQVLTNWRIYEVRPKGIAAICTVQFRLPVKRSIDLLPKSVRRLELLLDQTMGPGNDEGSLQFTARNRKHVQNVWANAALRPWALKQPYNSRQEVDAGLRHWAGNGPVYRGLYQDIQRQYPKAERALARFYRIKFNKSAVEAKVMATYVIDVAIRSHYSFHSERPDPYEQTEPNPWRKQ
jgi:hypothetical protein